MFGKNPISFIFVLGTLLLFSCKSKENTQSKGIVIEIAHFFENEPLRLQNNYTNNFGEQFSVNLLRYYLSNFRLQRSDGAEYVVPQEKCYFLVELDKPASYKLFIPDVPLGEYKSISFLIGVDSLRNTMSPDKRTGNLDVGGAAEGMYWNWNTGYIFFKLEGNSPVGVNGAFRYHIGGYGGYTTQTLNNIRSKTINFGNTPLKVQSHHSAMVHLKFNLAEFFRNPHTLKIAHNSDVMFAPISAKYADNSVNLFSLDFVHN
ncbi:MbnP family protein [Raineya orbicola]|jgi:hypothetical protein|uniref:Copper-binding protein MbnP-like domain-containing protein n=1 Tax=Raineya orbicola TaxID=2016530 RepID=A0A2N3I9A3_9BACT|nr:MbnP family protein [Raineya orbicola]PKQ66870.1 hypothetical protein Rain11_2258 [Raineya orbicola]